MPSWLQAFAEVNPFTTTVDAMRALFLDTPHGNDVWGAVAWSIRAYRPQRAEDAASQAEAPAPATVTTGEAESDTVRA